MHVVERGRDRLESFSAQPRDRQPCSERFQADHQGGRDLSELLSLAHREHHDVLEAARSGDAERCATELAAHLGRTALAVMAYLDPAHDPHRIRAALHHAMGSVDRTP